MGCAASGFTSTEVQQQNQKQQQQQQHNPQEQQQQTIEKLNSEKPHRPVVKTNEQVADMAGVGAGIDTNQEGQKRLLLVYQSNHERIANRIKTEFEKHEFKIININEKVPQTLAEREESVQWCGGVVIMACVKFQRALPCTELLDYVQTNKKPICTILAQPNYTPSGSVGAISTTGIRISYDQFIHSKLQFVSSIASDLTNRYNASSGRTAPCNADRTDSEHLAAEPVSNKIAVAYTLDAIQCCNMIVSELRTKGFQTELCDSAADNSSLIKRTQVFIAILSSDYQVSDKCRREYELARSCQRDIVPVIGVDTYRPSGWLALGIAGKIYHALANSAKANKRVYDSNPMNDFSYSVAAMLQDTVTEEERESKRINILQKDIQEAERKLISLGGTWPPKSRPREQEVPRKSMQELASYAYDSENLVFNYIHHEITRMTFTPPKPLFDGRGIPLRRKFDAMLSYQWDIQHFVREFYMDLSMHTINTWMDIWGGMQGNIYEAMSNAVECSSVIISFLTAKYQQSANCKIELKYAIARNKPIIFIRTDPNLELLPWIAEAVSRNITFDMCSIQDAGNMDNGVPRINRISDVVRKVVKIDASANLPEEMTEEVYALNEKLQDALCEIHRLEGTKQFEICTRCGAKFTKDTTTGCKNHRAYFMGGTIMAGRWVCCSQREKDSLGCTNTDHTSAPRTFQEMPGYGGCFQWVPA